MLGLLIWDCSNTTVMSDRGGVRETDVVHVRRARTLKMDRHQIPNGELPVKKSYHVGFYLRKPLKPSVTSKLPAMHS